MNNTIYTVQGYRHNLGEPVKGNIEFTTILTALDNWYKPSQLFKYT